MQGGQSTIQNRPIIVVTGGNRGIGFEICRQLAVRRAGVILTARSEQAGLAALSTLAAQNLPAAFHPLDVTSDESIGAFRRYVERAFGGVDVLINNAGVLNDEDATGLDVPVDVVRRTLETNTLGPLRLAQALAPMLQRSGGGRIINISSGLGAITGMEAGYPAYRISKAALNAVTRILAAELAGEVVVNSACPGWVKTDMGGPNADREVHEGADTPVWLALDAPLSLTGKFLRERKVIDW